MIFLITIISFGIMEFVSWFTHKYIMHGPGWVLHRDHHQVKPGFFERNDAFFLVFAIPSALSIALGFALQHHWLAAIGFGIALYGLCYFLVHDVFIHQRLPWLKRTDNPYFRALRKAHKIHHKHLEAENGECFGMLVVPWRFVRDELKRQQGLSE